jgi:uncharacterized protein (TIGR02271 family)
MQTTKRSTVVGVFQDHRQAEQAVAELRRVGFRDDQIGIAARQTETGKAATEKYGSKWEEGAVTGAVAGAAAGALIGLGILAGVIPGIGPAIAGGTLAVILANAAGGAAVAGVIGALIGLGIPEEEARYYENEFQAGRTIVTVKADGRADEASAILHRFGAYDMSSRTAAAAECATPAGTATAAGGKTMQLKEEELHARKQPVQTGEVKVRKDVVTEHKTMDVPVKKEEVVVERRPASGQPAGAPIRSGEEIRIPVKEEEVHVEKRPVVKEEVTVSKRQVQETEQVGGTVRKEEVKVEREGDVDVRRKDKKK